MAAEPRLETLTEEECLALLSTVTIGRVGVALDALPAVLPVEYVFEKGAVVFRTAPGTKLHCASANAVVAFEADDHSSAHHRFGWSVLVRGGAADHRPALAGGGARASFDGTRPGSRRVLEARAGDRERTTSRPVIPVLAGTFSP